MKRSNPKKVQMSQGAIKRNLVGKARPKHASFTFRFEERLFEDFRTKANKEGHSATEVLEAAMKAYLSK